jgi:hypothetical protein
MHKGERKAELKMTAGPDADPKVMEWREELTC